MSIQAEVEKALDGLRQGFQADGADLTIVSATASQVTIQLIGNDETCWDCIVPPDQLRTVIDSVLRQSVSELEAIDLIDPREST
jgi:Fe-S cluster biogenesis protein NfuA